MPVTAPEILLKKRSPSRAWSSADPRILIFSASLVLKGILGVLFFGSVDLVNSAVNSLALLSGGEVHLPYLPTVNAFIWFGGVVAATLPVPLSLSMKLVPILFDSLLAVLIYDLVRRSEPGLALRAGLLYALSPLSILITSFHAQWDAIALFFLLMAFGILKDGTRDSRKELLSGALFGLSLFIKPIGLPFLIFYPPYKRRRWSLDWPAMLGLIVVWGIASAMCWIYGYSTTYAFIQIIGYSHKGVQTFGLPFSPLLAQFPLIQAYRLVFILPAIAFLASKYRKGSLTAMDAMLLFYLYCLAITGICPQYLLWPLPLLIVTRRFRVAALYTAVATGFLLVYYSNPWATPDPFENPGTFAPLRSLHWLLPPGALEKHEFLPFVHAFGNVAFPAFMIVVGVFVVMSVRRKVADERNLVNELRWCHSTVVWYAAPPFLVFITILATRLTVHVSEVLPRLRQVWDALPVAYGLRILSLTPKVQLARELTSDAPLNIVLLLGLFTAIWCAFAAATRRPRSTAAPPE